MKNTQKLGFLGEKVTKQHLIYRGLEHVSSNYRKKYGEIDLIMKGVSREKLAKRQEEQEKLFFFEVKTVSRESFTKETANNYEQKEGIYRPEDNIDSRKLKKMTRVIRMWMEEQGVDETANWSFNVALVYWSRQEQKFYIKIIWDLVL